MTASAVMALRAALRNVLLADAPLVQLLAGPKIFDEAPAGTALPYVCFGEARSRDWSTSTDTGAEHTLTIDAWTQHHGVSEALEIADLVAQALAAAVPTLSGHRLVSLQQRSVETRREQGGRLARARLTFRAVTEAA